MLDHVSITVSDIAAAEPFYDAIMKALGIVKVAAARTGWVMAFAITPQNEIHLKAMPVILTTQDVRGTGKG